MRADIPANLHDVKGRLAEATARSGRDPDAVELLVVTKTWPAAVVCEVFACGHDLFGENKLQEAAEKIPMVSPAARWHFIGHLQRNKARKALELFEVIHSVDSLRLARSLDRLAGELGVRCQAYLQVNAAEEESKSGFGEGELCEKLSNLLELQHLQIRGLMTIPPAADDPEHSRSWFRRLRELRDELEDLGGHALPGLSMGMSHDFEVAVEEGSTIVRVGSSIFGPREPRPATSTSTS